MGKPTDLVQGTLDLLILRTIEHQPKHGWAIAKRISKHSRTSRRGCRRRTRRGRRGPPSATCR